MENRTIRVDAQINRRNEVVKAKTKRSTRVIRFDQSTNDRLKRWADTQSELQERAGELWMNSQGLIATTARGTPINQRNVHRSLKIVSQNAHISPAMSGYDLPFDTPPSLTRSSAGCLHTRSQTGPAPRNE